MRHLAPSLLLLLTSMISIQYGATLAKGLFPLAGAIGTTSLRVFFSAIILAAVSQIWKVRLARQDLSVIALYGVCLGLMNVLFYSSLQYIPLGVAVAVEFIGPLTVATYLSKKKTDFLWIFIAMLGLYILLPQKIEWGDSSFRGILLAFVAGIFWGLYIIFGKRASVKASSLHVAALGMICAATVVVPLGFLFDGTKILNSDLWIMGILVGIFSSALPYTCEIKAMLKIHEKNFGILMSLEPVIACLIGYIFLQELLTPLQWGAIFLIIAASAGSSIQAARK